ESGTTIVYKAFDESLHRHVLLKVLHKHLSNDPDLRERFVREARACAALHSEHIAQVYDLTEIDGAPAIVMEFVHGKSLKDVIADGTRNNIDFAKKAAVHVLRGLALAHERGIIHRDIKPGNILVSEQNILKVTDFGLAYVAMSPTVTMEGMVLGTPAYMAPEQVRGDDIDARTDLFALGVTLVEILTGERIFEGTTYSECMKKVLAFKADDVKRFEAKSSPEFTEFLKKLLNPKKDERFSSAREALHALGEKGSAAFVRPVAAKTSGKKLWLSAAGAIILSIVVLIWMKLPVDQPAEIKKEESAAPSVQKDSVALVSAKPSVITNAPVTKQNVEPGAEKKETVPPVTVPKDSAKIYLTSTPWAKVYVDNQFIGETPFERPVLLAAGTHSVMFTNPSFDPIVKMVTVESSRDLSVKGNFLEQTGFVRVNVKPWAEIFVEDQYKETTPLSKPMMLSAGKHTFRFKNPSFPDIIKEVAVNAKDTVQLTVEFTK
ncbi:MAG: protein kinase domain-containing protein, partial [Bacteroidota bacterium]